MTNKKLQRWFIFLLKISLQKCDLNTVKVIFFDGILWSVNINLYSSYFMLYIKFFAISRLECFEKNKNKTRTFVGLKSSKNKKFNLIKTLPVILVLLQVSKKSLRKLRTRSLLKIIRSSHRRCSEFTGKHLCQSLFFSKVAGLRQLY